MIMNATEGARDRGVFNTGREACSFSHFLLRARPNTKRLQNIDIFATFAAFLA